MSKLIATIPAKSHVKCSPETSIPVAEDYGPGEFRIWSSVGGVEIWTGERIVTFDANGPAQALCAAITCAAQEARRVRKPESD